MTSASQIRFDGRVAVVTGCGHGLGRAYALLLAARGARIVVNDLARVDEVVAEILAAGGTGVASHDSVATPEGAAGVVRAALDAFGRVDIVINSAGRNRPKPFLEQTPEDLALVVDVQLKGSFYVAQAAFGPMVANRYGRLLFTSSSAGIFGNTSDGASYAAAQAGILGLANAVGLEGAAHNVTANVIAPYASTAQKPPSSRLDRSTERLKPQYVAPLVAYLVSERCTFTRQVFSVGGGAFARVFVGVSQGWRTTDRDGLTPETVGDRIGEIMDVRRFSTPRDMNEEFGNLWTGRATAVTAVSDG